MAYEVFGPFDSKKEAAAMADVLGLKGYRDNSIIVFSKNEKASDLDHRTNAIVEGEAQEEEEVAEKLMQLGMPTPQAAKCKQAIEKGKILIIVNNNDIRMGNDPADKSGTMEEIVVYHDK